MFQVLFWVIDSSTCFSLCATCVSVLRAVHVLLVAHLSPKNELNCSISKRYIISYHIKEGTGKRVKLSISGHHLHCKTAVNPGAPLPLLRSDRLGKVPREKYGAKISKKSVGSSLLPALSHSTECAIARKGTSKLLF